MPAIRTRHEEQLALAVDDLIAAASQTMGLTVSMAAGDGVLIDGVGSERWRATVHARSSLSHQEARALVAGESSHGDHVVVADQISVEAKGVLAGRSRWSWLDRRCELHLRRGSTVLEVRFAIGGLHPEPRLRRGLAAPSSDGPIRGRAGISYAAASLLARGAPPSVRSVARQVDMAPSTISEAAGYLRAAGLIRPDGEPERSDLFWALAEVWRPIRVTPVAEIPAPSEVAPLSPNLDDLSEAGWAQGGDEAALAWGAPMFIVGNRPWMWVPDQLAARRAERALGIATWQACAAVIAVAPTPLVCINRLRPPSSEFSWPTPHPLFLALDLAQDRARGREILRDWVSPLLDPPPWRGEQG